MKDIVVVTDAEYVEAYKLALTFSDGVRAVIDFTRWIKTYPFFEPLEDLDYFKNFSVDGWTVVWPNGADVGPETLHKIAIKSLESQPA
jgi:hypothetical protein